MTDTLLCCPFCGGAATVQPWVDPPEVGGTIARIRCTRCSAQSAPYADASYAAEAWNTREPSPSEARLREMLCRVQDVIRYAANSEGGLAAEIDLFLGCGITRRAKA